MCRQSLSCSLLGEEPSAWSKTVPAPRPPWFDDVLLIFTEVVARAASGDKEGAIEALQRTRSDEMREWFGVHGQWSGKHRARQLGIPTAVVAPELFDTLRSPEKYAKAVFLRDSYTCRYCGLRQVAKEILYAFEKVVGTSEFHTLGTNAQQHGITHGFRIVADHVVPFKKGGRTSMDNLVSACPACNYGKDAYTVEQLGIEIPLLRPPVGDGWMAFFHSFLALSSNRRG